MFLSLQIVRGSCGNITRAQWMSLESTYPHRGFLFKDLIIVVCRELDEWSRTGGDVQEANEWHGKWKHVVFGEYWCSSFWLKEVILSWKSSLYTRKKMLENELLVNSYRSRLQKSIEAFFPLCPCYPETYSATLSLTFLWLLLNLVGDYSNRIIQWAERVFEYFVRLVKPALHAAFFVFKPLDFAGSDEGKPQQVLW